MRSSVKLTCPGLAEAGAALKTPGLQPPSKTVLLHRPSWLLGSHQVQLCDYPLLPAPALVHKHVC